MSASSPGRGGFITRPTFNGQDRPENRYARPDHSCPKPGRVTNPPLPSTNAGPGKDYHPALAIPTTGQSVMVSRPPLMAALYPLMTTPYPLMTTQSVNGPLHPLMVSLSNHPIPVLRQAQDERAQVGQPKQPSFRRKPESRKSSGKEPAGYRGFWIPAFAGTTVSRAGTTVLCCH